MLTEELLKNPITWKTDRGLCLLWIKSSVLSVGNQQIALLTRKIFHFPFIKAFENTYTWWDNSWQWRSAYRWNIVDCKTKQAIVEAQGTRKRFGWQLECRSGNKYFLQKNSDEMHYALKDGATNQSFLSIKDWGGETYFSGQIHVKGTPPEDDILHLLLAIWTCWLFDPRERTKSYYGA